MAHEVLTDKITVTVGKDEYVFRVPSPMELGRISLRARNLRVEAVGQGGLQESGLDNFTTNMFRGMALLEMQLETASVKWPYSEKDGRVVVDPAKFPANKSALIAQLYVGFDEQMWTFLDGGAGDAEPPGPKAVAG